MKSEKKQARRLRQGFLPLSEAYAHRAGQSFLVMGPLNPSCPEYAVVVRFPDGREMIAWPEEVYESESP